MAAGKIKIPPSSHSRIHTNGVGLKAHLTLVKLQEMEQHRNNGGLQGPISILVSLKMFLCEKEKIKAHSKTEGNHTLNEGEDGSTYKVASKFPPCSLNEKPTEHTNVPICLG